MISAPTDGTGTVELPTPPGAAGCLSVMEVSSSGPGRALGHRP